MSTWTFRVLALTAALSLTGCVTFDLASLNAGSSALNRAAPQRVAVAGGEIVIAGPRGFCVDRDASREDAAGAFVLLGSCASIAGDLQAARPSVPAVLTATVSPEAVATMDAGFVEGLADFFRTTGGRAALSRSGEAETLTLLDMRVQGRTLFIHSRDTGSGLSEEISDDSWRALMEVNGRLVTATVIGFDERPMSEREGFATLRAFASRIVAENKS
jgi:hypothetical protein